MVWGTMPFGSLAGGVLGSTIGLRSTLWVAAIGGLVSIAWLTARPVLELKEIPTTEAGESGVGVDV
jgi:predicted MFS family arabinose efflux permease